MVTAHAALRSVETVILAEILLGDVGIECFATAVALERWPGIERGNSAADEPSKRDLQY
jgi:hypothetical protein